MNRSMVLAFFGMAGCLGPQLAELPLVPEDTMDALDDGSDESDAPSDDGATDDGAAPGDSGGDDQIDSGPDSRCEAVPPEAGCLYGAHPGGECVAVSKLLLDVSQTTCALFDDGSLWCWGQSEFDQYGQGTTDPVAPVLMDFGGVIQDAALSAGAICALVDDVTRCIGSNAHGQIGLANGASYGTVMTLDRPPFVRLFGGSGTLCGETLTGKLMCWGWPLHRPELLFGDPGKHHEAVTIELPDGVQIHQVELGVNAGFAVLGDEREVWTWGNNYHYQLGISAQGLYFPTPIPQGLTGIQSISAGDLHACAILGSGSLSCWGHNAFGEAGSPPGNEKYGPTPIGTAVLPNPIVAVDAAWRTTIIADSEGDIYIQGFNQSALLDVSQPHPVSPAQKHPFLQAAGIHMGHLNACTLDAGGAIVCWGDDRKGALGQKSFGLYEGCPVVVHLPPQ